MKRSDSHLMAENKVDTTEIARSALIRHLGSALLKGITESLKEWQSEYNLTREEVAEVLDYLHDSTDDRTDEDKTKRPRYGKHPYA